ncbi:MAG: tRNA adenosine(34) deaminase TadA [Candidatus Magnetoovum sp. WYHC-5]|nr:tRNA adenosine(34) deaminase TadA [Candidatus Magnetoovum sp. WYHC-5]
MLSLGSEYTKYMEMALEEAKKAYELKEIPVGAVLVAEDGGVLSKAHNLKETLKDCTAHAELLALRQAALLIGGWRLNGYTLFVTKEPCIMCSGAILNFRVSRLIYGCYDKKGGGVESLYKLLNDPRLNHRVEVMGGVLEIECGRLLTEFFKNKRYYQ